MEIILVLGIILMLAAIGLGVFSGARQNLSIDLETDKLIAAFNSLRANAQAKAECFGIAFEQNKQPQKITAPYLNRIQGCGADENRSTLPWQKEITVSDLILDGGSKNEFAVWFMPPNGKLRLSPDGASGEIILAIASPAAVSKKIVLNPNTGVIEKK